MNAFHKDAFNVSSFGWSGAPDDIWIGAQLCQRFRDMYMDLPALQNRHMHPRRECGQTIRCCGIIENDRTSFGNRSHGARDAELITVNSFTNELCLNRKTFLKTRRQFWPQFRITIAVCEMMFAQPFGQRGCNRESLSANQFQPLTEFLKQIALANSAHNRHFFFISRIVRASLPRLQRRANFRKDFIAIVSHA